MPKQKPEPERPEPGTSLVTPDTSDRWTSIEGDRESIAFIGQMTRLMRGPCVESHDAVQRGIPFEVCHVIWHPAQTTKEDGEVVTFCRVLFVSRDLRSVVSAGATAYKALTELLTQLNRSLPCIPPLWVILRQGMSKQNRVYHWLEPVEPPTGDNGAANP